MSRFASLLSLRLIVAIGAGLSVCPLGADQAAAADIAYGIPGLAWPGMSLAKLRTKIPPGMRLLCGTDRELPPIEDADRTGLTVPRELAEAGVDRCGIFAPTGDKLHKYQVQQTKLADNPADFWVLMLVDGDGVQRVVQLELAQSNSSFASTLELFGQTFGPPQQRSTSAAHWKNGRDEAIVTGNADGRMQIFLIDNELQALLTQRIAAAHPQP